MKLVWIVTTKGVGTLVWESFKDAKNDMRSWKVNGRWSFMYPKIMTKKRLELIKEFTGAESVKGDE